MKAPNWAVNSLGRKVYLSQIFFDGITTYPVGSAGRLVSIQAGKNSPYATVVMDGDLTNAEENFRFSELCPERCW